MSSEDHGSEVSLPQETEDQMLARHKKEHRDIIATATGLKRQATKKTRKEVNKKCQEMEDSLTKRHKEELEQLLEGGSGVISNDEKPDEVVDDDDELTPEKLLAQLEITSAESGKSAEETTLQKSTPKPKRNRQKERLARREANIKQIQSEALKEAASQVDYRAIELQNMSDLCKMAKLKQHDIKPDGHCLFASIADQLETRHGIKADVAELRSKAANHIRSDPNTYAPFLFDEATMTIRDVKEYTDEIENTALWGGDMEIMALAKDFDCPITVIMSGRSPLKINEGGANAELKLGYYKHSYGLGEHYNSLRDEN